MDGGSKREEGRMQDRGREAAEGGGGKWEVRVLPHVYGIWMYM